MSVIGKYNGVLDADIAAFNGVNKTSVAKVNGIEVPTAGDYTQGLLYEFDPAGVGAGTFGRWASSNRGSAGAFQIRYSGVSVQTFNNVTSYYIDPSNDYLQGMPVRTAFQNRNEWTFAMWINSPGGGQSGYNAKIFSVNIVSAGNFDFRDVRLSGQGQIPQFAFQLDDGTQYYLTDGSQTVMNGWNLYVISFNNQGQYFMRVNNGQPIAGQSSTNGVWSNVAADGDTSGSRIGNIYNSTWADCELYIGYLAFWDRAITPTEAGQLYDYSVNTLGFSL